MKIRPMKPMADMLEEEDHARMERVWRRVWTALFEGPDALSMESDDHWTMTADNEEDGQLEIYWQGAGYRAKMAELMSPRSKIVH